MYRLLKPLVFVFKIEVYDWIGINLLLRPLRIFIAYQWTCSESVNLYVTRQNTVGVVVRKGWVDMDGLYKPVHREELLSLFSGSLVQNNTWETYSIELFHQNQF